MPILAITDAKGHLLNNASLVTIATLAFPANEKARLSFLAAHEANILISENRGLPQGEGTDKWLKNILDAPEPDKLMKKFDNQSRKIEVAGNILLYILNAADQEPRLANVNRAVYILEGEYATANAGSPRWISTIWSQFKPVAHLCAAVTFWASDLKGRADYDLGTEQGLPKFLSLAENFRKMGESHFPVVKHHKKPISTLPKGKMWSVPADLILPTVEKPTWPPLPDWTMKRLNGYTPE